MTLPDDYFEDVYRANADPWHFETSPYEAAKYDRTLAALPQARYRHGLEVGCSIGVLTSRLAGRVDTLLALDVNARALGAARARNAAHAHVSFEQRRLPGGLPGGTSPSSPSYDLIVLSEVLYYLSPGDLQLSLAEVLERLAPGGSLILVHWTPPVHDYPQTGDEVHDAALAQLGPALRHTLCERHGDDQLGYRLDVLTRPSGGADGGTGTRGDGGHGPT